MVSEKKKKTKCSLLDNVSKGALIENDNNFTVKG